MSKLLVTTSWDDGHVLDLQVAGLLKKYNLTGTFYVSPKCRELKFKSRLDDQEIRLLAKRFEIGAHTMTHPRLTRVSLNEADKEIRNSKSHLEKVLGKKVVSFCYPGGEFDKKHKKIARDAGFSYARTVRRLHIKPSKDNFAAATTIHAYKHYQDVPKILVLSRFNPAKFWLVFNDWSELGKLMFDKALKSGGVYHVWGHSWEIDNNNDWERLERLFRYISDHDGVSYVTNKELVREK